MKLKIRCVCLLYTSRTGGIAADGPSLYYAVRIALKHGTIHKRAGVALVGVADNVFLIRFLRCGEAPLFTLSLIHIVR